MVILSHLRDYNKLYINRFLHIYIYKVNKSNFPTFTSNKSTKVVVSCIQNAESTGIQQYILRILFPHRRPIAMYAVCFFNHDRPLHVLIWRWRGLDVEFIYHNCNMLNTCTFWNKWYFEWVVLMPFSKWLDVVHKRGVAGQIGPRSNHCIIMVFFYLIW